MAMHDANFSDHFDGGDKTNGQKNMRLGLEARRKTNKAIMSNSVKPPALKKTSRKRKNLIPIGKEVGGYKKARKHQHRHCGLKKTSREVINKPFGSKTGTSEEEEEEEEVEERYYYHVPTEEELDKQCLNFDLSVLTEFESETEKQKKYLERWGPNNILRPSKEDLERKVALPITATSGKLFVEPDLRPDPEFGKPRWFRHYLAKKSLYDPPSNEKLDKLLGYKVEYSWSQREFNRVFGLTDSDSDSDSDSCLKTPRC